MKLTTFKTVEVGALPKGGLLSELENDGHYVSSWAKELIEKMPLNGTIENIDLCKMTLAEMGFTKPATWSHILERVKELGDICPPEVGPLLRLPDTKQEKSSWYYVAMEQIADSGGNPRVFRVKRGGDGGSWLSTCWVNPDGEWGLDDEVVFRLRKNSKALTSQALHPEPLILELAIKIVKDAGYQIAKII